MKHRVQNHTTSMGQSQASSPGPLILFNAAILPVIHVFQTTGKICHYRLCQWFSTVGCNPFHKLLSPKYIYIMIPNSSYKVAMKLILPMGIAITCGTVLKGSSIGKVEKHWSKCVCNPGRRKAAPFKQAVATRRKKTGWQQVPVP